MTIRDPGVNKGSHPAVRTDTNLTRVGPGAGQVFGGLFQQGN